MNMKKHVELKRTAQKLIRHKIKAQVDIHRVLFVSHELFSTDPQSPIARVRGISLFVV